MGRADRTVGPMHRTRLALLTALLSLACAGPAAAAQRFGIDVSTTTAPGSSLTAGKAPGTYDLSVVNGGPAASVTIQGPGVARVVFLPKQEFRVLEGLTLQAGLYTVQVKAFASRATTQLLMPIGVPLTSVGGRVDGGAFSLIDPKFGVGTTSLTVPAGWAQLVVSTRAAAAVDTPVHLEGPGASVDVVVPAGQTASPRVLAFLPGPGEYAVGVPGGPASKLVVADSAAPQSEAPPLPADVTPPKAAIGKLDCKLRGRVNRCGQPRVPALLHGTVADPGAGASSVARVQLRVEAGSGCWLPDNRSIGTCGGDGGWWKATVRNGKWSARLPWAAFAYTSGVRVTVRAIDRAGNEQPVHARARYL